MSAGFLYYICGSSTVTAVLPLEYIDSVSCYNESKQKNNGNW